MEWVIALSSIAAYCGIGYVFNKIAILLFTYFGAKRNDSDVGVEIAAMLWPVSVSALLIGLICYFAGVWPLKKLLSLLPEVSRIEIDSRCRISETKQPVELLNFMKELDKESKLMAIDYKIIDSEFKQKLSNFLLTIGYRDCGKGIYTKFVRGGVSYNEFKDQMLNAYYN